MRSICEDPAQAFNPQIDTCYATVNQTMRSRWWHRKYENVKPDRDGWHPTDGAIVWVTPDLPTAPEFLPSDMTSPLAGQEQPGTPPSE